MSNKTKIEWAEATLNPFTGCNKRSAGCDNCYAAVQHARLRDNFKIEKYNHDFYKERCFHPKELEKFARKKKPRLVFVGSMADWLHIDHVRHIDTMAKFCRDNQQHFYLFLTKRSGYLLHAATMFAGQEDHVGFGVTIENQKSTHRLIELSNMRWSGLKFASFEPLLENIDLDGEQKCIDWAIIGCESGPKRRPCNNDWVTNLMRQLKPSFGDHKAVMIKQLQDSNGKVVKAPEFEYGIAVDQWLEYPPQIEEWRSKWT
jgi:protein gp37